MIFKRLDIAISSPLHFFKRLEGRPDFRIRIGDYRAIADIDFARKMITVTAIGHRKDVYEN